jgi:hypothetical protein
LYLKVLEADLENGDASQNLQGCAEDVDPLKRPETTSPVARRPMILTLNSILKWIKEILGVEKSLELTLAIDQIPISSTLFDGTLNQDLLDVLKPVQSVPSSPKMLA